MVFKKVYLFFLVLMSCLAANAQGVYPKFSSVPEPAWYYVRFEAGGGYLEDMGSELKTAEMSQSKGLKWQFIGDRDGFLMRSENGRFVNFSGKNFSVTTGNGAKLKFIPSPHTADFFELQRVGSNSCMNQFGGAGIGKALGEWSAGDPNNPIRVMPVKVELPKFSKADEDNWYFIQFINKMKSLEDRGVGQAVQTAEVEPSDEQLWKLVGEKGNFQLVNKAGHYAVLNSSGSALNVSAEAFKGGFSLLETNSTAYGSAWTIQPNSKPGYGICQNGGAGVDKVVGMTGSPSSDPVAFVDPSVLRFKDYTSVGIRGYRPDNDLTLWYTMPATTAPLFTPDNWYSNWMEYSLPIGNGQLGASLFGGIEKDQILFNEKTVWSGTQNDNGGYGKYEVFGSVYAKDLSGDFYYTKKKSARNYYRQLDLTTATGKVSFENNAGVVYTREYIASNPANVIAAHYTASNGGKVNLLFTMESGTKNVNAATSYADGEGTFHGKLQTVTYDARFKVVNKGGSVKTTAGGVEVRDAEEVLLLLAGGTDFDPYSDNYISNTAALTANIKARINDASEKTWEELHQEHVADFQKYFNRVDFNITGTQNKLPTNELVDNYGEGVGMDALMLERLYFAYGRYLEISSSRGVDLPSNLQGIWNNNEQPAWNADIHSNINVQMNYWPAETTNLSEMHLPFLNYIWNMAENHKEWKRYAKAAGQDEGWTCYTENNIFGGVGGFAHNYVIANAWYCTHLWQHYRYTLDKEYLKKVFPAMWSASRFWIARLKKADDGTYECPNEYSPEHGPSQDGVAHAQQLVFDLLDNTLKAIEVLGKDIPATVTPELLSVHKDRLQHLDCGLAVETYDGAWGTDRLAAGEKLLREWKYSPYNVKGAENGHRHMSHLMCLYPFSQIVPGTELFDAAVNSMKLRGDGATGWSMGWKINLWARALDGDHARKILNNALRHANHSSGVYYNLFDAHNPFQIDGNFGACAGMAEMIMQSNSDTIRILPALPHAWSGGYMKGLKAVGDFTVDVEWTRRRAKLATIVSNQGQPLFVHYKDIAKYMVMVNGSEVKAKTLGSDVIQLDTKAGDVVTIDFKKTATGIDDVAAEENLVDVVVDGRKIMAIGARKVVVNDLSGRAIQTSDKPTFSVDEAAGQVVVLKLTDRAGKVSCHKIALR